MAFLNLHFEQIISWINRMPKREKTLFYGAALVILVTLADRIVVRPVLNVYRSMDQQVKELQIEIKRSFGILSEKELIESETKQYSQFMIAAKSTEEQTVGLLKYIEGLANEAAVNLLYVKPGGEKEEGGGKKYYVTLECEAQMPQLIGFFYKVESSDQFLKVEKFSVQPIVPESSVVKSAVTIAKIIIA